MDEDERRRLAELEDARADERRADELDEDAGPGFDPPTGGPALTGLTPPD